MGDDSLKRGKRLRFVIVVLVLVCVSTLASFANPNVTSRWQYYTVTATTADGLRAQMRDRGPRGSWGVTRWAVQWTSACQVTLDITYVVPRHSRRGAIPGPLRVRWDSMIAALKAHELRHGAHAMSAARELVHRRCNNGNQIVRKWQDQDRLYDQRTRHGRTEGVVFP